MPASGVKCVVYEVSTVAQMIVLPVISSYWIPKCFIKESS